MIASSQMPARFLRIVEDELDLYESGRTVQVFNEIPDSIEIPIKSPNHWLRIPNVICVYVDMLGSTKLSAELHDKSTAGAYQLFTGTAVKLFNLFGTPYIDVRGDGAFALFNKDQPYTALASAVTIKTFAKDVFIPTIKNKTGLDVGCHIGIDQKTVLVRKIGLRRSGGRTDRQNEVWAGKPVNMAAKLASSSQGNELLASDRFFTNIRDEHALLSCGCPDGTKTELWTKKDLSLDERFDFSLAYSLTSIWCKEHGREFCEAILACD